MTTIDPFESAFLPADKAAAFAALQLARRALQLADHGYVLERGRISLSGDGASLLDNAEVQQTYLGNRAAERTGPASP